MKKIKTTFGAILFASLILTSCGGANEKENFIKVNSNISGLDYREIIGKSVENNEVREFFIKNKISFFEDYIRIKNDRNGKVLSVLFGQACPVEYMPFGVNFVMNTEIVRKTYGTPDKIYKRTYIYSKLKLAIQFSDNGDRIVSLGVCSETYLKERFK